MLRSSFSLTFNLAANEMDSETLRQQIRELDEHIAKQQRRRAKLVDKYKEARKREETRRFARRHRLA